MDPELIKKIVQAAAKYVEAQIAIDEKNRYSLLKDWTLPAVKGMYGPYEDEAFLILPVDGQTLIQVKAFASTAEDDKCDGCSLSPDKPFGLDFIPGALFHDRWYGDIEKIAAGLGISFDECRKLGDQIFASINLKHNDGKAGVKTLSTIYYWGVRLFGGIYHKSPDAVGKIAKKATKSIMIAVMALTLAGCSGCVTTVFDDDDNDYEKPIYEKVVLAERAGK